MTSDSDLAARTGELGARLRELRLQSGTSLRALARELGISASAVSQIERGVMRPSVSRLIAFVSALGVPLSAVFAAGEEIEPDGDGAVERFAIRRSKKDTPNKHSGGV